MNEFSINPTYGRLPPMDPTASFGLSNPGSASPDGFGQGIDWGNSLVNKQMSQPTFSSNGNNSPAPWQSPEAIRWGERNGIGKTLWNKEGGLDMGNIGSIMNTIGGFGKLYMGYKANKISEDTLAFNKESYAKNLAGQIKSYNLALEDRVRARHSQNGTEDTADAYINKHKMEA